MAVRVMIVDDDLDMRLLIRSTLGFDASIDVVAEACDGVEALEVFRRHEPDVCVLDQRMPGRDGIVVGSQILREHPSVRIVLFCAHLDDALRRAAEQLGMAVLRKDRFMDLPAIVIELSDP